MLLWAGSKGDRMVSRLRTALSDFVADDCPTLAAALAYYTVFALPPLLFLLITLLTVSLSLFSESEAAERQARKLVEMHAASMLGNTDIQKEVGQILSANESESRSWWKSVVGFVGVLVGASGVLSAMQNAFNRVWQVTPAADGRAALRFLIKRVISLAMILGLGFILLVSFVVNTIISFVVDFIGSRFSQVESLAAPMNFFASLLIIACMLAAMYRYLPDARVTWRDASVGALFASLLFAAGRALLQLYFELADPAAQLGSAAASLAAIFIWVYYTSMIVLFGAEISKTCAVSNGNGMPPETGAVHTHRVTEPTV